MTVYIVTRSAIYYPEHAAGDWLSAHETAEEARTAFDAAEANSWGGVFLIEVTPPSWRVLAEK